MAGFALADSGINWDRVAACESGGRWSANTGNGYSGGLQFSPGTWAANGGTGSAAQASREEQIRVAENLVRSRGTSAWPNCMGGAAGHSTAGHSAPARSAPVAKGLLPPTPRDAEPASTDNPAGDYTIQPGDTLSGIADKLDVNGGWQRLVELNPTQLVNPDLILPGARIATK
ncbi:LysM peptidoglycan-binding domain-containing protein [Kutzneria sp. CA-103260]|uniref:LysM peptidoglycan-binding domain-containing protein n=1 Tax=Kutzneria sp. CA-103260 TaxID=2802641 RepID=UPI001BF0E1D9|nr:transglycosylase family protein [Kutzneria sp. CA-103260]QUQ63402.1 LysM peptidoglycan-binding domain-containing protein [Kutzneria sp. CA-103260]